MAGVRGVSFGANVWRRGRWEEGKGASSPGLSSALWQDAPNQTCSAATSTGAGRGRPKDEDSHWLALTCNTFNGTSCKWRSQCARRHWTECGNESLAPIWAKVARATLSLYWPTVDCLQTLFSTWGAGMQLLHFCRTQYFYDFDIKSFPSFWRIIIFDGGRSWDFGMFKWQIIHSIWRGSWNNPENQDVDVLYNNLRTWTYGTNYV